MEILLLMDRLFMRKRILLAIMKVFLFLMCTTVFSFSSINSFSQEKIILEEDKLLSVEEVFKLIKERTEYDFIYPLRIIENKPKVQLKKGEITLLELLQECLPVNNLQFELTTNNTILIKQTPIKEGVEIQKLEISGIVYDANGVPLAGANILEKGTTNGTQSDFDGKFLLEVNDGNAILVISYLGFLTKEVAVDSQSQLTINLEEDAANLDEIVVTGYSSTSKRNLTGAISTIDTEELSLSTSTNLTKGLQGAAPGLVVRQGSPQPGFDDNPIYVRGTGSFNNSEAMVVIDGVPDRQGGLSRLNPEEIESISVIKDATAAIYGSRSANGVIVVTTKKGNSGKVEVNYSSVLSFDKPIFLPDGLNSLEWVTWHKEGFDYIGGSPDPTYTDVGLNAYTNGTADGYVFPNGKSLFDLALDKNYWAPRSRHNLSFRGGNEKTKYFLSATLTDQKSSIKEDVSKFKQANIRMNIEQKLTNFLTLSSNVMVRKEDNLLWPGGDPNFWNTPENTPSALGRFLINVYREGPLAQVYWPNGSLTNIGAYYAQIKGEGGRVNTSDLYLQTNFDAILTIPSIEGLQFKASVALDNSSKYMKKVTKPVDVFALAAGGTDASDLIPETLGSDVTLTQYTTVGYNKLYQGILSYETNINDHTLNVLLGSSREESNYQNFWAYRSNLISYNTDVLSQGEVGTEENNGGEIATARMNYFGNLNYSYKNRYFVQFLARYDGSYLFPANSRYGFFPGVSVGWVMSDEKFMENSPFDFLKLRGSYGELGNDNVPANQYSSSFTTGAWILGDNRQDVTSVYTAQTLNESRIGNPNITWEVAKNIDIGLEGRLFNNKLSFEIDYYKSDRDNILTQPFGSIADITGIQPPFQNIGKTTNKGWEFTLGYKGNIGDLKFNTTAFVSTNDNTLIFADEPEGLDPAVSKEGKRIGAWRYWDVIGVFQNQAQIDANTVDYTAVGIGTLRPGDLMINDVNGDGLINSYDYKFTNGSVIPKMTTSFNLQMNYKNFDFTARLYGTFGGYIDQHHGNGVFLSKHVYDNRWTQEGDQSEFGRATHLLSNPYTGLMIAKTDHIKLQYLEIGYNLDSDQLNKIFGISVIDNLRLFVNGNDLFIKTFDDKLWSHPESFTGDVDNGFGVLVQLPPSETLSQKGTLAFANKSISFGLNLKF